MNKAEKKERKKILILFSLIVALLLIILFSAIFYIRASRPMRQAKEEAIQLAKEHVDIQRVDQFYWFTREETYFSLVGETEAGKNVVVIIPKTGDKLLVFDEKDGLTQEQTRAVVQELAPQERIKKITLGMFNDQVVWEVMTKGNDELHYYLIDFKDGSLVHRLPSQE